MIHHQLDGCSGWGAGTWVVTVTVAVFSMAAAVPEGGEAGSTMTGEAGEAAGVVVTGTAGVTMGEAGGATGTSGVGVGVGEVTGTAGVAEGVGVGVAWIMGGT
jgi:hypothetical protein